MAPLSYTRLNVGLSRLLLDADKTLPHSTYADHHLEILRIVNEARASIKVGRMSAGQIKHQVRHAIDYILKDLTPPCLPPAPGKRTTKRPAALDAGVRKRSLERSKHTAADLKCVKALLELAATPVVFAEV